MSTVGSLALSKSATMTILPFLLVDSIAASTVRCVPAQSKATATPCPPVAFRTRARASSLVGSKTAVTPH